MKPVYLTRHARNRMRLYDIALQDVIAAIENPDRTEDEAYGKRHAWRGTSASTILRVTFKEEVERYVVITVTPKRMQPEKRHEDRV